MMEANFERINLCELLLTTDLIADSNIRSNKFAISVEMMKNTKKMMDDQLEFFATSVCQAQAVQA